MTIEKRKSRAINIRINEFQKNMIDKLDKPISDIVRYALDDYLSKNSDYKEIRIKNYRERITSLKENREGIFKKAEYEINNIIRNKEQNVRDIDSDINYYDSLIKKLESISDEKIEEQKRIDIIRTHWKEFRQSLNSESRPRGWNSQISSNQNETHHFWDLLGIRFTYAQIYDCWPEMESMDKNESEKSQ